MACAIRGDSRLTAPPGTCGSPTSGRTVTEEIDLQPRASRGGENYGWNIMEGAHCYSGSCSTQGLTLPIFEYTHSAGCSITGGFVYRGRSSRALRGTYIYADYCSGDIWGLTRKGAVWMNRLLSASGMSITTFGEDEVGEIYVADTARGRVYRIDDTRPPRTLRR